MGKSSVRSRAPPAEIAHGGARAHVVWTRAPTTLMDNCCVHYRAPHARRPSIQALDAKSLTVGHHDLQLKSAQPSASRGAQKIATESPRQAGPRLAQARDFTRGRLASPRSGTAARVPPWRGLGSHRRSEGRVDSAQGTEPQRRIWAPRPLAGQVLNPFLGETSKGLIVGTQPASP